MTETTETIATYQAPFDREKILFALERERGLCDGVLCNTREAEDNGYTKVVGCFWGSLLEFIGYTPREIVPLSESLSVSSDEEYLIFLGNRWAHDDLTQEYIRVGTGPNATARRRLMAAYGVTSDEISEFMQYNDDVSEVMNDQELEELRAIKEQESAAYELRGSEYVAESVRVRRLREKQRLEVMKRLVREYKRQEG